ncbi:PIR protein, putative [Plasmodium sp.]|nr:PIR protein, putative [Plasmodium sp.]
MKLQYTKILLFFFPLNILARSENKPHITPRRSPTITSRVLSECDINTSIYNNDADMKSVKENFNRHTSQRFEEYEKRMITQRKKCKEQCDKDIQKIILKDKIDKSLAEKVEQGCLRCGFGLGGVAAGVGIFGAIAVSEVKKAALVAAAQKGIDAGIKAAIEGLKKIYVLSDFSYLNWFPMVTPTTYDQPMKLVEIVSKAYNLCTDSDPASDSLFCGAMEGLDKTSNTFALETITREAANVAGAAGKAATTTKEAEIGLVNTTSTHMYSAIGYSVLAILIILLVMVIIFLVLRYRRKNKMNKKLQYTKLLNQ